MVPPYRSCDAMTRAKWTDPADSKTGDDRACEVSLEELLEEADAYSCDGPRG